jgi:hypothetical protein
MIETRHVDVLTADAVVILSLGAHQLGKKAVHVEPDLLSQIAAITSDERSVSG